MSSHPRLGQCAALIVFAIISYQSNWYHPESTPRIHTCDSCWNYSPPGPAAAPPGSNSGKTWPPVPRAGSRTVGHSAGPTLAAGRKAWLPPVKGEDRGGGARGGEGEGQGGRERGGEGEGQGGRERGGRERGGEGQGRRKGEGEGSGEGG